MKRFRTLLRCEHGATILEFAIVAPVFLMLLFGIIDASRLFWMRKTIDEVAFSTARCMSISSACDTTLKQRSYAVERARSYGVRVNNTVTDVQITGGTTCKGRANSNQVIIRANFASGTGGFVPLPDHVRSTACFPVIS